ncbi:MAG: hypothetical protein CIT01_01875 [Methanobacterium sp. BRmetb2]|jgi:hypothetical protein|nr:MAG: hypothetical protein CIT01_01875 [Methanobacterium sp. BRmetb2]
MEITDARGKPISKGSHVIYSGTGTIGEVFDVKIEEKGSWAKMENDLWYNSEYLEVLDKIEKSKTKKVKEEDIKSKIDKMKQNLEDVDMSSELCDGGG